jgi:sulfonate transport system permease protein
MATETKWGRRLLPWLIPAVAVAVWALAVDQGWVASRTLPSPAAVVRAAVRLTASGELPRHLAESSRRALMGLLIGGTAGFALGLVNGLSAGANRLFDSSIQMLRNVPHLALIPLVILWFGIGEAGKLFLIATGVLFPMYINTVHGIRSIDPRLLEMGRLYGLGPWALFREVIFPGALPSILVGLRYALGVMWLTLIVAETIAADNGIGFMTMNARDFLQTDVVLLGILLYALLGKLADLIARGLERWLLRWNPVYHGN